MTSIVAFTGGTASGRAGDQEESNVALLADTVPVTGWNVEEHDTPEGTSYFIWQKDVVWGNIHGGWWSDAEKVPGDDGFGHPNSTELGGKDDNLCWAITACNMMEYTGWGFVNGMDTPDESVDYFEDHVTDYGNTIENAITWWFTGILPAWGADYSTEYAEGGWFYGLFDPVTFIFVNWENSSAMFQIEYNLRRGLATGISIDEVNGPGGHAITVWGINVDETKIPGDNARYKGIWVSDSDSHKTTAGAEDYLTYFSVTHVDDEGLGFWNMANYYGGWMIDAVVSLAPYPYEDRPMADIRIDRSGGVEGSEFIFNASASSDPDNLWDPVDPLTYRWDFEGDGIWDTEWSSNPFASHTYNDDFKGDVYVQAFDGRLTDVARIGIEVLNVAPTITLTADSSIHESDVLQVKIDITDPGTEDTFVVTIDWNDGTTGNYNVAKGVTTKTVSHTYLDDDPTGTPSDLYVITASIVDKDGGSDSSGEAFMVWNVAPTMTSAGDAIDENGFATVSGTITDPGIKDTFTLDINWGDGQTSTYDYPKGTTVFSETHQYLDDNPTGTPSDDYSVSLTIEDDDGGTSSTTTTVTVNNIGPITSIDSMDQPNSEFILPVIHVLDFHGSFTDAGIQDTHTAVWDWGDGTSDSGTVVESGGSGTVTGSHVYAVPGTYSVILTVTDDDTGYSTDTFEVVVVDASGAMDIMDEYIQDLSDGSFAGNANNKKNALSNMIDALHYMVRVGDYHGAITYVQHNLVPRVDGFIGGNANNDWIKDPQAQEKLAQMLNDICDYLASL
jgi:hypothetical protein